MKHFHRSSKINARNMAMGEIIIDDCIRSPNPTYCLESKLYTNLKIFGNC